ncbi:hypothetical protein KI387_020753, partial [Taxus chinensis]
RRPEKHYSLESGKSGPAGLEMSFLPNWKMRDDRSGDEFLLKAGTGIITDPWAREGLLFAKWKKWASGPEMSLLTNWKMRDNGAGDEYLPMKYLFVVLHVHGPGPMRIIQDSGPCPILQPPGPLDVFSCIFCAVSSHSFFIESHLKNLDVENDTLKIYKTKYNSSIDSKEITNGNKEREVRGIPCDCAEEGEPRDIHEQMCSLGLEDKQSHGSNQLEKGWTPIKRHDYGACDQLG